MTPYHSSDVLSGCFQQSHRDILILGMISNILAKYEMFSMTGKNIQTTDYAVVIISNKKYG